MVVLLWALPVLPQANTGELRLTVADPIGLGLKSTVELVSEATQYRNTFTTDAAGKVDAERLPFGRYQLEVHAKGFSPVSRLIEVRSALPEKITIQLSLSPVTTTVDVSDQQTLLDPAATGAVERAPWWIWSIPSRVGYLKAMGCCILAERSTRHSSWWTEFR